MTVAQGDATREEDKGTLVLPILGLYAEVYACHLTFEAAAQVNQSQRRLLALGALEVATSAAEVATHAVESAAGMATYAVESAAGVATHAVSAAGISTHGMETTTAMHTVAS